MEEKTVNKSIFKYAMEYGTWLGGLFILRLLIETLPPGLVTYFFYYVVTIWIPFLFYRLVRLYASKVAYTPFLFSQLWSFGILLMLFASLLSGIVQYIYYQYVATEYIPQLYAGMKQVVDGLEQTYPEGSSKVLSGLKVYLNTIDIPTPIEFVMQIIFMNIFFGSLLSIFVSPIVVFFKRKKEERGKNNTTIHE